MTNIHRVSRERPTAFDGNVFSLLMTAIVVLSGFLSVAIFAS